MIRRRIGIFTAVMLVIDFFFLKYVLLPWSTDWFRMLVTIFLCMYQGYCLILANVAAAKENDYSTWCKEHEARVARWKEEKKKREQESQHDN